MPNGSSGDAPALDHSAPRSAARHMVEAALVPPKAIEAASESQAMELEQPL